MVKLTGYYQLPNSMPIQVEFEQLFDVAFMRKYTRYRSFEKFLQGGKFNIASQQDFEDLPESLMDNHVKKNTKFVNWKAMLDMATDLYARRQQLKLK